MPASRVKPRRCRTRARTPARAKARSAPLVRAPRHGETRHTHAPDARPPRAPPEATRELGQGHRAPRASRSGRVRSGTHCVRHPSCPTRAPHALARGRPPRQPSSRAHGLTSTPRLRARVRRNPIATAITIWGWREATRKCRRRAACATGASRGTARPCIVVELAPRSQTGKLLARRSTSWPSRRANPAPFFSSARAPGTPRRYGASVQRGLALGLCALLLVDRGRAGRCGDAPGPADRGHDAGRQAAGARRPARQTGGDQRLVLLVKHL